MVFKLVNAAAKTWRRLKGENQLGGAGSAIPAAVFAETPVCQQKRLGKPGPSTIPLTLAAKMHRRLLQHSRKCQLFRGRSFAGLQIAEGAETLHGNGADRCSRD
jgi:hypothetical protein